MFRVEFLGCTVRGRCEIQGVNPEVVSLGGNVRGQNISESIHESVYKFIRGGSHFSDPMMK